MKLHCLFYLLMSLSALSLSSCSNLYYAANYKVDAVNTERKVLNPSSEKKTTVVKEPGRDDILTINWLESDAKFIYISLKNNTNSELKINWDESVIQQPNNSSSRLMPAIFNQSQKSMNIAPTILLSNATVNMTIVPQDNVNYSEAYNYTSTQTISNTVYVTQNYIPGNWIVQDMYPDRDPVRSTILQRAKTFCDQNETRIRLPVRYENESYNYLYTLKYRPQSTRIIKEYALGKTLVLTTALTLVGCGIIVGAFGGSY